ncbi:MAG TPA: amidohydrolase family protein [Pyrinomonadaceae bacterium]|nr:amidohydrolase family protein [Pyrinomonadaceae bacterium]
MLCVLSSLSHGQTTASALNSKALVFIHVTVIDATGAPAKHDMSVVVKGNRITALGKTGRVRLPAKAEIVDAAGKFLIPGLWDMHVHLGSYEDGKRALPLLISHGVTGVRDMASPLEDILRLRKETVEGTLTGPQIILAGPIIQGPLPFKMALLRSVSNAREVMETVNYLKKSGADFIKLGDTLPRDLYFVLATEAKRQQISFVGHLPVGVSAGEASAAGQRSIEHFGSARYHGVILACSTRETELSKVVQGLLTAAMRGDEAADTKLFRAALVRPLVESFDEHKAATLFGRFARNQTWQVPTLVALRDVWDSQRKGMNDEDRQYADRMWQRYMQMLQLMTRAGVKIMAGTDVTPYGVRLHDELYLLVTAGLTPMQALQAATRNPAQFLNMLDTLGTIEKGKTANLVLLDADPLADIRNIKKINMVVLNGKMIPIPANPR